MKMLLLPLFLAKWNIANIFANVPKTMVSSYQEGQLRWEMPAAASTFRNMHTHPAKVGDKFFTKCCKGSASPLPRAGEVARGCLLMAVMRKMEVLGSSGAEAATAIRESFSSCQITHPRKKVRVSLPRFPAFRAPGKYVCPLWEGGQSQDVFVMHLPRVWLWEQSHFWKWDSSAGHTK